MQSIAECIMTRRSIRRFEVRSVEQDKLQRILEVARWTPSWANSQCWEVIVVTDEKLKQQMSELLSPKNPASLAMARGPVTLAICAEKEKSGYYKGEQSTKFSDWFMFDLGLMTQNISLAAHSEGLGSVIVGAFEHDKVKKILEVPDNFEVVALLPMGYPAQAPSPPKRRELEEFVHFNGFGREEDE